MDHRINECLANGLHCVTIVSLTFERLLDSSYLTRIEAINRKQQILDLGRTWRMPEVLSPETQVYVASGEVLQEQEIPF